MIVLIIMMLFREDLLAKIEDHERRKEIEQNEGEWVDSRVQLHSNAFQSQCLNLSTSNQRLLVFYR